MFSGEMGQTKWGCFRFLEDLDLTENKWHKSTSESHNFRLNSCLTHVHNLYLSLEKLLVGLNLIETDRPDFFHITLTQT